MGYILDMGIEFNFDGIDNQQSQMVRDGEEWKKWYKLFMLRQDETNCRCCCLGFVSSSSNIVAIVRCFGNLSRSLSNLCSNRTTGVAV